MIVPVKAVWSSVMPHDFNGMCVLTALIIKVVTPTTDRTDSAQYTQGIIVLIE